MKPRVASGGLLGAMAAKAGPRPPLGGLFGRSSAPGAVLGRPWRRLRPSWASRGLTPAPRRLHREGPGATKQQFVGKRR